MKTLTKTSKTGKRFIYQYMNTTKCSLRQCYKTYSTDKENAERWCYEQMLKENGKIFRILSWNTFQFTCGWMQENDLRIETATNSYIIKNVF